jgi:hypothetical protein
MVLVEEMQEELLALERELDNTEGGVIFSFCIDMKYI